MLVKSIIADSVKNATPDKWPTFDGGELDRNEFLTSSEVAGCLRKAFFAKYADEYPHQTFTGNGFTERGHNVEAWIVSKMVGTGNRLLYVGRDQRSFYDADIGLSGTPDGILITPSGEMILLEFKSYDPRSNVKKFPKKQHIYQCNQNMYLVNKCLNYKIKKAIILYVNASDYLDQYEFAIDYDEGIVAECIERAELLWSAKKPDDVEAEGMINGDCDYCKATGHCSDCVGVSKMLEVAKSGKGNFLIPPMGDFLGENSVAVVDAFLVEYLADKEKKASLEDLKQEVKILLKDQGTAFDTGTHIISMAEMEGRVTLDKKALAADGIDIAKYEKVGAPYYQMAVKEKK